ncbi:MAG: response regulator [Anaerolineae bacterium]|jgi:CheY-like chemotaxis protein
MAGETVLIVEDRRENIVHLANNVLKPSGYEIITAMNGQRGLERALHDMPDLIIMDLNMPKMDGLEVLSALRERQVDIPVILTTFYGSEHVAEQALRLGAADYIVKPYEVEEMLNAVKKTLADRPIPARPSEPEEMIPLTRQVERWMRDMNILTRIGKALVAQLDLERVCKRTVEAAVYVARADHALLFLVQEEDEALNLRLCATRGPRDRQVRIRTLPTQSELANQVARSGKALVRTEAQGEAALDEITGEPVGPLAAVPLRWQGETLGVLFAIRSPGESPLSETNVEWLSGLADYAAIAVRNAQACERRTQPSPAPSLDAELLAAARRELDQLSADLQATNERVRRLAAQLAEGKQR